MICIIQYNISQIVQRIILSYKNYRKIKSEKWFDKDKNILTYTNDYEQLNVKASVKNENTYTDENITGDESAPVA